MKTQVWNKIKTEADIDIPFKQEVFDLLTRYLDRVEFVKDHIGIRDFFFLAEKKSSFTSDLFSAFNVTFERTSSRIQKEQAFRDRYCDDPMKVLQELKSFFTETKRVLYVGIGFYESETTKEQTVKALRGLEKGIYETEQEALSAVRTFPDWYEQVAKHPNECLFLTVPEEKQVLMNAIDELLDQGTSTENEKKFLALSAQYKKLA